VILPTLFTFSALFMLLTGGVLGLMHKALPQEVQPSAADWRIGTLLCAGGTLLLAATQWLPPLYGVVIASLMLSIAMSMYWRSARRLCGLRETWLPFAHVPLAVGLMAWYALVEVNLRIRVGVASLLVLAYPSFMIAWTLLRNPPAWRSVGHKVLAVMAGLLCAAMVVRGVMGMLVALPARSVAETNALGLVTASAFGGLLPVVGTAVFLLLCMERLAHQLQVSATTDVLTGLPNRRVLLERGQALAVAAAAGGPAFAVIIADVDHFKSINDRFGHDAGDIALKAVAGVLRDSARKRDMAGRYGGEEFVILLPDASLDEAVEAAHRICVALGSRPVAADPFAANPLTLTASFGVAAWQARSHGHHDGLDAMLTRADRALYLAKAAGRNCVRVDK
jgi:diguanylate cyclase (GGDEF)-like protein